MLIRTVTMTPLRSSFLCSIAALALAACGDTSDTAPGAPEISTIAEARAVALDAETTVEGFVTVAPGTFSSATSEQGFAIQDDSGGVYVSLPEKIELALDAKVRVTGRAGEMAQLRTIASSPAQVQRVDGGRAVEPEDVATGSVKEPVEGRLVSVSGQVRKTFEDDSPYGYKLYVDDGSGEIQIFIHISAGFKAADLMGIAIGDSLAVTGFTSQYEDTYEVAPRAPADLLLVQ
ncbi:DNA-binding protein [Sorangium sp. So ce1128]